MTIARAIRYLLALVSAVIVVWSFYDVAHRYRVRRQFEADRPITLTVMHWGDRAEDVIDENLCQKYMAEHPNIRIIRINPTHSQFRPKLKTMMAAGTPPDVFYLPPDIFPELARQQLIRPIDDYIAKERAAGKAAYMEDFWPILLKAWHYDRDKGLVGAGPLYGLPKDCTTAVMYVNLDLFERAGVAVPYKGWTWDEYEQITRKIRALSGTLAVNGHTTYCGNFELWSDSLRNIVWTFGGDYFATKPDGTTDFHNVVLDQPGAQDALKFIRRLREDEPRPVFNVTGGADNLSQVGFEQFLAGNIGVDGPVGRWKVPLLATSTTLRWDCVPVPYKQKEFQASQMYLTAWTMSSKTRHPDECFELIKFLCSAEGAIMQSRAGLAIPPLISVSRSDDFLNPPGIRKHNAQAFIDAIQFARIQQQPRQSEVWSHLIDDNNGAALQEFSSTTEQVAQLIEQRWIRAITSPLAVHEWKPMPWAAVVAVTLAVVATTALLLWLKARREHLGPLDRAQERAGFAFISPWVIGFLVLTLGPMVVSLLLSFSKWSAMTGMGDAQFVGTANYRELFGHDDNFSHSFWITVYYVALAVPVTQVAALAVALLMNTRVRGITIFRTIYFVPSVVSGVALSVLWLQIYLPDFGLMNAILRPPLSLVGLTPPDWLGRDANVWAVPAFVIMSLWGVGSGMIIYLAGLKGIPVSMYEAATIDGASAVRKFWNVTLPMLSPLIFYNVVMGIIGSFQIFTQAAVMTNGGPQNKTLFYVLNLYRQAFEFHQMGYASAMAWVLLLIILGLTILVFRASKNLVYYEGLKT